MTNQPNAEDKILASLSIHDYPSLFYLHDGEKMVSVELFSEKAIEKKLIEPDGKYTKLTQHGEEVAAAVVEYVVRLLPAEEIRALVEMSRFDKPRPEFIRMKEMRMLDRAGYITDFGRAVAAAAQIIEAGFTLADVTPAPATDPVIAALQAKIDQQAAEMMTLKQLLETAEKLAIDKTRDKRKADERITALEKDVTTLTEQRDTARTLAETYQHEKEKAIADAQKWQREHVKVAAAHNEVNELLEAFTAQHADGHVVIRDATEQHLDRFAAEGRTILNISFNRDDDMILVVGPKPVAAPIQPERTARTEAPTQPRRPVPPPVQRPPAPRPSVPSMPTASATTIQPSAIVPVMARPTDDSRRVPTFTEILEARTSGQIGAAQFSRYANALAGYKAQSQE